MISLLAHLAGEEEERHGRRADQRHLDVPDDLRERVRDVAERRLDDVMARADRAGDLLLMATLVVPRVVKAIENVRSSWSVSSCASAVIRLESRPPER